MQGRAERLARRARASAARSVAGRGARCKGRSGCPPTASRPRPIHHVTTERMAPIGHGAAAGDLALPPLSAGYGSGPVGDELPAGPPKRPLLRCVDASSLCPLCLSWIWHWLSATRQGWVVFRDCSEPLLPSDKKHGTLEIPVFVQGCREIMNCSGPRRPMSSTARSPWPRHAGCTDLRPVCLCSPPFGCQHCLPHTLPREHMLNLSPTPIRR